MDLKEPVSVHETSELHVHTSNNVEATFDFVAENGNNVERVLRRNFVLSTKSNVASTLLPFLSTMFNVFFMKFCPFYKVETNWTCSIFFLPKGQNFVWHCCQKMAPMSKQHSTLWKESFDLQRSTMLLQHCCWCGRGLTVICLSYSWHVIAECTDGYWGKNCANRCRCVSSGSCDKVSGCTSCDEPGWTGPDCNEDINECLHASYYCGTDNNSQCHNMNGSFSCSCSPWYQRRRHLCVCKCLASCVFIS